MKQTYQLTEEEIKQLSTNKDTFLVWKQICNIRGCNLDTVNPTAPGQFEAEPLIADDSPMAKLKREVEEKISASLNESNQQLAVFESTVPNFQTPQQAIQHWKEVFGKLSIADLNDKDGYTKVSKAISLCRTTRTTLDKMRKQEKEFYLQTGRMIDKNFNDLIELVEPLEEELKAKKKVIDDAKAIEDQRKADEKRLKIEARNKQLIDLKFVFNGAGYVLRDVNVGTGEIENTADGAWNAFVAGACTKAYNEQVEADKEVERLQEEEKKRQELALRTEKRKEQLTFNGFLFTDGMYVRPNQSEKFKAIKEIIFVPVDLIEAETDAVFGLIVSNAQEDTKQAQEEFNAKRREFEKEQLELREKEERMKKKQDELDERERKSKQDLLDKEEEKRKEKELAAKTKKYVAALKENGYDSLSQYMFSKSGYTVTLETLLSLNEEEFKERLAETDLLIERAEKLKQDNEEKERKRLEKEEKKKPEKTKLLEFADRISNLALETPTCKELNDYSENVKAKLVELAEHIRVSFGS